MPLRYRLRNLLALILPRWLALALAIRRVAPEDGYWPHRSLWGVPELDTGGGYRASHRMQDPAVDPREPNGGESSSAGSDHGWSGCTCAAAATAMAYQQPRGGKVPWGGDLRHRQGDLQGGTDLYDMRAAWSTYGETLTIRTGAGWAGVKQAHSELRAIVVQGEGNVPGSESFDGGHACVIGPETHTDGRWLFGDPLADGWQWVDPGAIRTWMERWDSSCSFAVGERPPAEPAPVPPDPAPAPSSPSAPSWADGYQRGVIDGRNLEADWVFASWRPGGDPWTPTGPYWDAASWGAPAEPTGPPWAEPWPAPVLAVLAANTPAAWTAAGWTAAVWRE